MNIEERILELRKLVEENDKRYDNGNPLITDTEYDKLYMELVDLELKHPEFYDENSPTQKIEFSKVEGLEEIKHESPMLSQEKINTKDGILKFLNRINDDILVQEKLDGLTIVLTYIDGKLKLAVTRGDGYKGEIVTHVMLNTMNLPKRIPFKKELIIRGEAIITEKDFERINSDGKYKSARNLASGTVRTLDGSIAKERCLKLVAFDLVKADGITFKKDIEMLEFLKEQNFEVVEYKLFKNTSEDRDKLVDYILSYNKEIRPLLPHKIDGLVLKCNDLNLREELGFTAKYPKWGIAYKFESLDATTTLRSVEWTVGKTGQITPKAIFDPIEIDGVSIKQASLANMDNIITKDIRIGDTIIVARSNDVIPYVIGAIKEERTGDEVVIEHPTLCPACHSNLVKENVYYYCINDDCIAQLERKLIQFVSRDALDIDGLGAKTVSKLYKEGLIDSIEGIYSLKDKQEQLLSLEKFGQKKVEKLLAGIENSKHASLSRVLFGLTISNLGVSNSKLVAKEFKTMKNILEVSKTPSKFKEILMKLDDFGDVIADDIVEFFSNDYNLKLINNLLEMGLLMEEEVFENTSESSLDGKIFVITGKLSKGRNEFKELIENLGGKVSGSVSKKTDYLLLGEGENGSSKHKKALEVGTTILSEEEFFKLIN